MNRPAFKNSELGPIPADWEVKRLGEIAAVITKGTTPTSIGCGFERYGINFIKAESISDNGAFLDKMFAHISERTNMLLSRSVLKTGDYLFSIAGVLGRVALVSEKVLPANTNQALAIVRLDQKSRIDRKYLFFALQSAYIKNRIQETNVAAAQANLSLQDVGNFCIAFPPFSEQHRIAAALTDADAWIESLDKLIEKKKLVKQGAMQALLSGKTRLPGFSGEWGEKRLGEIGEFRKGAGISREEGRSGIIPAVRYGELYTHHDCIIRAFGSHISEAIARRATLLKPGDILFACSGETKEEIGKCAAFIQPVRAYAGGDLLIMTPDPALCDSTFMGYALNSAECQAQKSASGQGDAVVHLHKDALEELEIRLPPTLAEQSAIAAVLSDMDAELASLSREKAKAEQIKQGMMQELLTGRVRLGSIAAHGEARDGGERDV